MSRILLASIGSLGDIHPMIAIGLALKERGHEIVFATSAFYHGRLARLGLNPVLLRPDKIDPTDAIALAKFMDLTNGTAALMRDYIFPHIRETYEDLDKAATGVDAIVIGELGYAGRIVAQKRGIPWASLILSPGSFFSAYDMPVLPGHEKFAVLHKLGPGFNKVLIEIGKLNCASWAKPYHELRANLGLPPEDNPIFYAKHSPYLVIAAFSPLFGQKQPDWPASAVITGFAYHNSTPDLFDADKEKVAERVRAFLQNCTTAGEAPILFTLGSSAMFVPGDFYEQSIKAASMLNRRAIFLMGQNALPDNLPDTMLAVDYVPYELVIPYASAIVHQCGVGTCAQSLRAGKPMLAVPFSHDQPDNAARLERMGTALTLPRKSYRASGAADRLAKLLAEGDNLYRKNAEAIAAKMNDEKGAESAAFQIEKIIAHK